MCLLFCRQNIVSIEEISVKIYFWASLCDRLTIGIKMSINPLIDLNTLLCRYEEEIKRITSKRASLKKNVVALRKLLKAQDIFQEELGIVNNDRLEAREA